MTEGLQRFADAVALVPAAGAGMRLGLGPKAFLEFGGKSLLLRAALLLSPCVGRVLVGVPSFEVERARAEVANRAEVFPGGASRHATIDSLFERSSEPLVVIHDAARPFASSNLVARVIDGARTHGAAAACVPSSLPMAYVENGFAKALIPRASGGLFQTPLGFHREVLKRAFRFAREHRIEDQTPFELAVRLGIPVRVIPGEETNLKITTSLDWEMATKVIAPFIDQRGGCPAPDANAST